MQALLEAIRKACLPGVWSQGVKLGREGAVTSGTTTADELTFRVRAPGHAIALTVTLYVEGPEWTCDCDGKVDPCAHVAAAAIAAAQAAERGEALTAAPVMKPARLVYRMATKDRLLTVVRVLVHGDGREERLADSIASSVARAASPRGGRRRTRIFTSSASSGRPRARSSSPAGCAICSRRSRTTPR